MEEDNGFDTITQPFYFDVQMDGKIYDRTKGQELNYIFDNTLKIPKYVINNDVKPFVLRIVKENINGKLLDGAEFGLYKDKDCKELIESKISENGQIEFSGLKDRVTYYLKEIKAPDGYELSQEIYEIHGKSSPEAQYFECMINGVTYTQSSLENGLEILDENNHKVISLHIVNQQHVVLPLTGSHQKAVCIIMGISCICIAVLWKKKGKNYV